MTLAILVLFILTIGAHISAALMWKTNQDLHKKLLRVTAKATNPQSVVQEVAPSAPRRTEEERAEAIVMSEQRRSMWRV